MHEIKSLSPQDERENRTTDQILSDVLYFIETLNVSFRDLSILYSRILQKYNKLFLHEITGKLSEQFFQSFKQFIEHIVSVKNALLNNESWYRSMAQSSINQMTSSSSPEGNETNASKVTTSQQNILDSPRKLMNKRNNGDALAVQKRTKCSRATPPPLLTREWNVSVDIDTDEDLIQRSLTEQNKENDVDLMTFSPTLSTRLSIAPNVAPLSLSKLKAKLQEEKLKSAKSLSNLKCTSPDPELYASAVKEYEETIRSKSPFGNNLLDENILDSRNDLNIENSSGYSQAILESLQQYEAMKKEEKVSLDVLISLGHTQQEKEFNNTQNILSFLQNSSENKNGRDKEAICAQIVKEAMLENNKEQDEILLDIEDEGSYSREEDMITPTPEQLQCKDNFSVSETFQNLPISAAISSLPSGINHSSSSSELSVASEYSLISEISATSEEVRQINHRYFKAISREIRVDQSLHPIKTVKNTFVHPGLPTIPTPDYTRQNTLTNVSYFDGLQPIDKKNETLIDPKDDKSVKNTSTSLMNDHKNNNNLSSDKCESKANDTKEKNLKLPPEIKIRKPSNNVIPEKIFEDDLHYLSASMQRQKGSDEITVNDFHNTVCSPPINRSIKPIIKNESIEILNIDSEKRNKEGPMKLSMTDVNNTLAKESEKNTKSYFPAPDYSPNSSPSFEKKNFTSNDDPKIQDLYLKDSQLKSRLITFPPVKQNEIIMGSIMGNKMSDVLVGRTTMSKFYPQGNFKERLEKDELLNWYRGYENASSKSKNTDIPPPLPARSRKPGCSKFDLCKSEPCLTAS